MANSEGDVKRSYRSAIRRERADATRAAIAAAAARLFAEQGYAATSIDEIAAAAGVSRATVFTAVGGKAEVLKQAYRAAVRGAHPEEPLGEQQRSREIMASSDPAELIGGYATVCVEFAPRLGPLYETVRAAAQADAEAAGLWEMLGDERRFGAGRVAGAIDDLGALREGLDVESAGDILWVLNDPGLYEVLVKGRGWSPGRFETWLQETMRAQLLG